VNVGYEFEQSYSQVGTAGEDDDQRYYSIQWHNFLSAVLKLDPIIYIPEQISLEFALDIDKFFGSIFLEGIVWWGTGADSKIAVCGGVGYFLQELLIQFKGTFDMKDCYKILLSDFA
jgi:hypothetical protein